MASLMVSYEVGKDKQQIKYQYASVLRKNDRDSNGHMSKQSNGASLLNRSTYSTFVTQ